MDTRRANYATTTDVNSSSSRSQYPPKHFQGYPKLAPLLDIFRKHRIGRIGEARRIRDDFKLLSCDQGRHRAVPEIADTAGFAKVAEPQGTKIDVGSRLAGMGRPGVMLGGEGRPPIHMDIFFAVPSIR